MTMDAVTTNPPPPASTIISPPLSFLTRVNYAVQSWSFKIFVTVALGLFRTVKRGKVNAVKPTYRKCYAARPTLENRVFIPKNWQAGTRLPLYIDIHGGGFSLCDPQTGIVSGSSRVYRKLIADAQMTNFVTTLPMNSIFAS